ncbi:MAG: C4-type zinc ribbon domain-containing protein [Bacteroidota bacterium]
MENKLRHLYQLQRVDSNLDELEELKGDLPATIRDLEGRLQELQERLGEQDHAMKSSFARRDLADSEILALREKVAKYKRQQFEVRTNKQYDALTREIDHATEEIARLEKEMAETETRATVAREEIESLRTQAEALGRTLQEKHVELDRLSKTTEEEELRYHHEREKLVARLDAQDLTAYERIRKAKRGKAIVPVRKGACGGCFARVPPQKLLELRQNRHVFACEHCGRILVSDEIVEKGSREA